MPISNSSGATNADRDRLTDIQFRSNWPGHRGPNYPESDDSDQLPDALLRFTFTPLLAKVLK